MKNGIDRINLYDYLLTNKNLGLLTNQTGILLDKTSTIDFLNQKYKLIRLFAPEHGIRGTIEAGEHVGDEIDSKSGIYVQSLYQNNKVNLDGIDVLIYDIQDVGLRFYTYIYVLANAMREVKRQNKKILVLDRANPLGLDTVRGTVIEKDFESSVGGFGLPTRYGLTVGEFAKYINEEYNIHCDLTVAECEGLNRKDDFSNFGLQWVKPSPNIKSFESLLCYEGTCIFEGTNISEGRGTAKPFEIIGAPFIDSKKLISEIGEVKGARLIPISFVPSFSKYQNEKCFGVQIEISNKNEFDGFETGFQILNSIKNIYSNEFQDRDFFDLLVGTDKIRKGSFDIKSNEKQIELYKEKIKRYLIYR